MDMPKDSFVHTTRRVLTVEGEGGTSFAMEGGAPEDVLILNGERMVRLWQTYDVPAQILIRDAVTDPGLRLLPKKFSGTRFYTAELPGGAEPQPSGAAFIGVADGPAHDHQA